MIIKNILAEAMQGPPTKKNTNPNVDPLNEIRIIMQNFIHLADNILEERDQLLDLIHHFNRRTQEEQELLRAMDYLVCYLAQKNLNLAAPKEAEGTVISIYSHSSVINCVCIIVSDYINLLVKVRDGSRAMKQIFTFVLRQDRFQVYNIQSCSVRWWRSPFYLSVFSALFTFTCL